MRRLPLALAGVLLLAFGIACRQQEPVPSGMDYSGLAASLRDAGAAVAEFGEVTQPFFSVKGKMLVVNGQEVQVFEYRNEADAGNQAKLVSPDGGSVGTTMISWVAPPHFFKVGRIVVLYVGDDQAVLDLLRKVLGPQFAGGG